MTITVKQIQANPLREDRVAVQHEVTPLEAPMAATAVRPPQRDACPPHFSHSNGRGVRRGSSKYAENVDPEATGQLGNRKTGCEFCLCQPSMVQGVLRAFFHGI